MLQLTIVNGLSDDGTPEWLSWTVRASQVAEVFEEDIPYGHDDKTMSVTTLRIGTKMVHAREDRATVLRKLAACGQTVVP